MKAGKNLAKRREIPNKQTKINKKKKIKIVTKYGLRNRGPNTHAQYTRKYEAEVGVVKLWLENEIKIKVRRKYAK